MTKVRIRMPTTGCAIIDRPVNRVIFLTLRFIFLPHHEETLVTMDTACITR